MEYIDRLEVMFVAEEASALNFGERLEYLRKRAGWSRTEVAHRIKLSPSTVVKHEYGDREPNLKTLKAYAMLYGVSIDFLLGLTDEPDMPISDIVHGWKSSEKNDDKLSEKDWLSEQDVADLKVLLRKLRKSGVYSANW